MKFEIFKWTGQLKTKYFEDYHIGEKMTWGDYIVSEDAIVDFAKEWDPQPFHVDKEAAEKSIFGGLTAAGCHVISISIKLINLSDFNPNLIAAIGWDELRFHNPVRPGDRLSLTIECLEARESESKPDRGIVRNQFTLVNQNKETVLRFQDIIIVRKREE